MKLFLCGLFALFLFSACGVKAPPVAPDDRKPEVLNFDCTPDDEKCDAIDPNYKSRKK